MPARFLHAHCLDALPQVPELDLIATGRPGPQTPVDPYAFGGTGDEHALSATVAVALREYAGKLRRGRWMLVMCASSWRSTAYMVEAVRGLVEPVRIAHWNKPVARTRARTAGWRWASVHVIAFRKGQAAAAPSGQARLDHITAAPLTSGRRAELPPAVAAWMVEPFAVAGGTMCDPDARWSRGPDESPRGPSPQGDPFAASGALVRAAAAAGMDALGIDTNPVAVRPAGTPAGSAGVRGPGGPDANPRGPRA